MAKIRYVGYGLIAGVIFGAFLGWMFHSWVGFIVRLFFVIIVLVPLVAALYFWRRVTTDSKAMRSSSSSSPSPSVRDADWIEVDSRSGDSR